MDIHRQRPETRMHDDGRTDHDRGDYDRETQAIAGPIHLADEAAQIAMHDLDPQVVRTRFPRDDRQVAREPMQDAGKLSHGGARVARNRLRLVFGLDQPIDEGRGVFTSAREEQTPESVAKMAKKRIRRIRHRKQPRCH